MKTWLASRAEAFGIAGILGLGLLAFCAAFYAGTIRPAESRLAELRREMARLEQLDARRMREDAGPDGSSLEERLQDFYGLLAAEQAIGEIIEAIDATARRYGVVLRQGSYRFSREEGARAGRYEVTYTAQTPYFRARIFLHEVLRDLPMLALDEVSFQRQQPASGTPEMSARFSILVRRDS
jgi:hypothetical protein